MDGDRFVKNDKLRVIPVKNYFILGVILLVSFLVIYYFYMWLDTYNETKLNSPILDKYLEVINYNELDDYLIENPNAIIYVSVLEDSNIREFEKKFKTILRKNELDKEILYMDITNDVNNIDNEYVINGISITDVPVIMVVDNGKLKSIYSIRNNDYDVDRLKLFIEGIKFSSEDELDG